VNDQFINPSPNPLPPKGTDAVSSPGWRHVLGVLATRVQVYSLSQATDVAATAAAACESDEQHRLWLDVRPESVLLTLHPSADTFTPSDVELARRISTNIAGLGLDTFLHEGDGSPRSVQVFEIGIDAEDIPAIRPFWKAVTNYDSDAGSGGPKDPLVDPLGQGPAIHFQQRNIPNPPHSRVRIDISVPHNEAPARLQAALHAGGTLLSDASAPHLWLLADPEGNEAYLATWQD
jgi:4a-hydroxytetrahydrobiopterin dehydratase